MVRYCMQQHLATCGPTAIVNTLKWLGRKATYRSLMPRLCRAKGFTHGYGINSFYFDQLLRKHVRKVRMRHCPRIGEIREQLWAGHCVILLYVVNAEWGHYINVIDCSSSGKTFTIVNGFSDCSTVCKIRAKKMRWMLRHCGKHGMHYPKAWYISR